MKRLIFKCALLLFLVGIILYLGGAAYKRTNTYVNLERTEGTDIFHTMPDSIDIAVFGASHGRDAFRCPPEGYTMFNFSLSSQPPYYDLRLMREYQDHIQPGALVVLTVSPMYPFFAVQPAADSFTKIQPRYYRILSPENIVDLDIWYWLRVRFSPLLTEDFAKISKAFLEPPDLVPTMDQSVGQRQLSLEDIPEEKERIHRDHIAPGITCFPEESPVMADAYREMLALCREKGWQAVLVTPPYPKDYLDCYIEYNPSFFTGLNQFMDRLCREYGVDWLDYSQDPGFAERYDLFRNIDHLNLEGAAIFDRQFFADIQSLGF